MNEQYDSLYTASNPLPEEEIPAEVFSRKEQCLAYISLVLGFLFIRFVCYHTTGLLTTVLFWLLFTVCILYLKHSGKVLSRSHICLAAVLYCFAAVYTITANPFLKFLNTIFLILTGTLLIYMVSHPGPVVFRFLPYTLRHAAIRVPFAGFGKCPAAATSGIRGKAIWKNGLYALVGLLIALPLTFLVGALLCSADDNMAEMLRYFRRIPSDELLILIPHLLFGILAGSYFFGSLYAGISEKYELCEEDCQRKLLSLRIAPNPMVYAAVTPICLLYILYFISQMSYFMGGFTGTLSEGYTYAEYARQGFFELCTVCCINFFVIGAMSFCAKHSGIVKPLLLKIYTIFLSVCSLFLAGTAIAKMGMYIDNYGMTPLRVYTTWFMLLLIIGFILVIALQFRSSLPVGKIGFVLFTVMFGVLCFSRPDGWIVRYNAELYLSGQLEKFDSQLLDELSDDAIAALCRYENGTLGDTDLQLEIRQRSTQYDRDSYSGLNLSAWQIMLDGRSDE